MVKKEDELRKTLYLLDKDKKHMYVLRKARKDHKCDECQNIISAKDEYYSLNIQPKLLGMVCRDLDSEEILVKKSCVYCFKKNDALNANDPFEKQPKL